MSRHRKTRRTFECQYATYIICNVAHEQFRRGGFNKENSPAILRWINAPGKSPDCPSHRLDKYTQIKCRVGFLKDYYSGNKPDDWSETQWFNYLINLWEKKF